MLLHGKSVMSLLLSIVGRARPLAQAPDAALSHPWLQRGETGTTLNTRPNVQYLHTRYRHWRVKRTSYSWEQAPCVSPHIWVLQTLHTAYPLSLDSGRDIDCAMHWAGHAALTLELMSFQTTQRPRENNKNEKTWEKMYCVFFRPCIEVSQSDPQCWTWTGYNLISAGLGAAVFLISITATSPGLTRLT